MPSVIELIERETGAVGVDAETPLEKIPMDSLDFIALLQSIREEIGSISDDDAVRCKTVGNLIDAVHFSD